jgi:TrmH family RNA methyltransferase
MTKYKAYKKEFDYSFTTGAYATIEMINTRPGAVMAVFIHSKFELPQKIEELCKKYDIPYIYDDKQFSAVNQKENSYIMGVFRKFECRLSHDKPHVVLVNPSDMGNLGTIIRTMTGNNIRDLAVITPAADIFNPKTVRATMGALFKINYKCFENFDQYMNMYPDHKYHPFILDADTKLTFENCPVTTKFSLIFGNEADGLDRRFISIGTPLKIPQSPDIDSLNLAVAVAVGTHLFATKNGLV